MAAEGPKYINRKFLKTTLILGVVLIISIAGLHIWFVNNARGVLKGMIASKSEGRLKLELSQLSFNFFTNQLQVRQADLVSTDSVQASTTYHIRFNQLTLRVASFWPLILQKRLLLDSIRLHDPLVEVFQWREDTASKFERSELSIPQEMGKLYNSMLNVLEDFGIRRIIINNAKLSLINKMIPGTEPVTLSNIYFNLARKESGNVKRDEFVENEQTVELRTTYQNIALPGGRHRLAFKNFNLELFRRRIILDSCTLTAIETDSSSSSYTIFFKKLSLIGVDFNAMYQRNLIKADSVYCEYPLFDIHLNTAAAAASENKERPDPEKIVRELAGDLDLAFVGVKEAGIHVDISGSKSRKLFNSNKDDFEMRGLRINTDSSRPVVVDRFDMLVRDYRLYNEDSSTAYSFDSIHFINNKIVLNNFSVSTSSSTTGLRNLRDFKIPLFELTGLDWFQLIFEQNLSAQEAVLYNPIINYTKRKPAVTRKKTNLFASLHTLDSLITLNQLYIVNGQVNANLGAGTSLKLQDIDLGLYSKKLLQSTNQEGLRGAIGNLSFSKGLIRIKDVTAQLQNARYTGNNLIRADRVLVTSSGNKINASISDIIINNLLLNEKTEDLVVDGLQWKAANINLQPSGEANNKSSNGSIHLKNVQGRNTQFQLRSGKTTINTYVQLLKVGAIDKEGNNPFAIKGLNLSGNGMAITSGPLQVNTAAYSLNENALSFINQFRLKRFQQGDTLLVQAPSVQFLFDINSLLKNDIHLAQMEVVSPVIKVSKWNAQPEGEPKPAPTIRIDRINIREPDVHVSIHKNDSAMFINMPKSENSTVALTDLKLGNGGLNLGSLSARTTTATFVKRNGEVMGVEKGKVELDLSDIVLSKKEGKPFWSGNINRLYLQNPNSFAIGSKKNRFTLNEASIGNLTLSSEYLTDFDRLLKFNVAAWLRTTTGQYIDSNTTFKWYNAAYDYSKKTLSLDSFVYFPTQPRDTVIAHTPYQIDYITFHSGAVQFTDFDLEQYKRDTALIANTISISKPVITIFRDKQPPFLSGIYKPMPVDMIRKITLPLSVKAVRVNDGLLSYTERNAKTRAEGTLSLTHLNVGLANIKNRKLGETDSLLLTLNAYLLDSAFINLRVKESYTDTLSGFLMSLRMKPTTLSFLNPVLAPLSNVIISSGTIDSLQLRAIGSKYLALGEMNMYYHDLRVKLIKGGEQDQTTFLRNVVSFLANTLIIRKSNRGRTGLVYFKRLQDRSFFNYLVKTTFSGMATSIGVIKNPKYKKQYRRELRKRNLPPLDLQ